MTYRRIGAVSLARLLGEWRIGSRGRPAYRQLHEALRLLILDGRLGLATRLPGERELAQVLRLSRTTVTAACASLRDEGYLSSRRGSGSVTCLPQARRISTPPVEAEGVPGLIDLSVAALPATEVVHRAYRDALERLPLHLPGIGYEALGLLELREVVAAYYERRGVATSPSQIMITYGAQHAIALVVRMLCGPGDRVAIDHPTYPLAIEAILRTSARPVPVALPPEGWDVDALIAAFRQAAPRMAYLQPDFHNPTGRCMDAETRRALARAAAETRTLIVADETVADLWLDEPPPPPLAGFDEGGFIISVGSASKSFWGGLRIGWIRAEESLISRLSQVRASLDLGTPVLEQLAAVSLITRPDELLEARRETIRERRDVLLGMVAERMPGWRVARPAGGLSAWAELPIPAATALAASAENHGLRLRPGPRFGVDGAFERFVRLPYSHPPDILEEAVRRLSAVWQSLEASGGRQWNQAREIVGTEPII